MRMEVKLDQKEMEKAILEYVKSKTGMDVKSVYLGYCQADSRDPREISYFYATASE